MIDLMLEGGRALDIDGDDLLGPHGVGAEADVHAGVTGADDHHPLANLGIGAAVDLLEEVEPLDQALMARERDNHRVVGAAGDHYRIVILADTFELLFVNLAVDLDVDAEVLDALNFTLQ